MAEPCPTCGFELDEFQRRMSIQDETIRDQAVQLSSLRGQLRKLRNQQHRDPSLDPHMKEAQEVFDYWNAELCGGRARELNGKRLRAVLERLGGGHTVEGLKRAVDGAKRVPYVTDHGRSATGRPEQRQAELELICREEAHVMRFAGYAEPLAAAKTRVIPHERLGMMQTQVDDPAVLERLRELRGWTPEAVRGLGLGLDRGQIVFPVHDAAGTLVGVHRYQPNPEKRNGPKLVAQGSRELFPAPESLESKSCWLIEGEPDSVAVLSAGLPGVAAPGVATWKEGWAERFERFDRVYVCFDCDSAGREAAAERVVQLAPYTDASRVDLDPGRQDGYDVGDLLLEYGEGAAARLSALTISAAGDPPLRHLREDPFDHFCRKLEEVGCLVRLTGEGKAMSQCPNHDDRRPSLAVTRGDDRRVLLHCHAATGCTFDDICAATGVDRRDVFAA